MVTRSVFVLLALAATSAVAVSAGVRDQARGGVLFLARTPAPKTGGEDRLAGISNYLVGSDPNGWQRNEPRFAGVPRLAPIPRLSFESAELRAGHHGDYRRGN